MGAVVFAGPVALDGNRDFVGGFGKCVYCEHGVGVGLGTCDVDVYDVGDVACDLEFGV